MESTTLRVLQDPETFYVLGACAFGIAGMILYKGFKSFADWIDRKWSKGVQTLDAITDEILNSSPQDENEDKIIWDKKS